MEKPESVKLNQRRIKTIMALFLVSLVGLWFWNYKTKQTTPDDMAWIPGGEFDMGTLNADQNHKEEGPAHAVVVKGFWMDTTEVTNAQFSKFVEATGYVTTAEKDFSPKDFPNAPPETLKGGSLIFQLTPGVDPFRCGSDGPTPWWKFTTGATWRHPQGPASDIKDKMNYPVICITWNDAQAYAAWAGKRLPTEAEWVLAAQSSADFAWGQVWEWTSSEFRPFPGFTPHPYRDYSQPWFDGRPVLKGACSATRSRMRDVQYRNFSTPDRSDIFAGFRSVAL